MHLAALEFDLAVDEGENRVILAEANIKAGFELGAALADDDRAGLNGLSAIGFDAAVLGIAIAAVAG